jgi:hypothetical protein
VKYKFFAYILYLVMGCVFFACTADTNYQSYKDLKKKGEKIFIRDLSSCQQFSNLNIKRSEGSKGAGEIQREKNFIFYRCMKKNYWILKE